LGDIVAFERERRQPFVGRMNAIQIIRASAMRIGSQIAHLFIIERFTNAQEKPNRFSQKQGVHLA
jgi:hypothetical protein